ncbi:glycoside hydrolase family 6 protein [Streptomyces sp. NPDC087420]|uniref:glycoside hydrolase family 6 protein n=1 Tax=Streptomyces sp. NPDC087420 TaxID=3365785 RepID=UPI0038383BA9
MDGSAVRATALAAGALLLLAGCSSGGSGGSGGDGPDGPDGPDRGERAAPTAPIGQRPKADVPYWVDPDGTAAREAVVYEDRGDRNSARLLRKIAEQPAASWIGPDDPRAQAEAVTTAATEADRDALLVLYNIPHRDCGQYSKGGAADGDAYRTWIDEVAQGIGARRATVILEPDAVLHLADGCTPEAFREERYGLLGAAVERLGRQPGTSVYLDAGNPGWRTPDALFEPLRRAGLARADGFAVNVSNFFPTAESVDFGKRLSARVGGKPFVIDTSRNGNGSYTSGDPGENWCNPPGRALGEAPTVRTGDPLVKAYLWIKRPGESDGECRGGPRAGEWWAEYAVGLARNGS